MSAATADLHTHSTASDGTLSPRDLIRHAKDVGLVGIALTDHDTIGGIADAADEAAQLGVRFIPGIEISAKLREPGTLHILGYGIDPSNAQLTKMTAELRDGRDDRNVRIIAKLNALGISISIDEVLAVAAGTVGRPHIAQVLTSKGIVSHPQEAFAKYLGHGKAAYEDKERFGAREAIDMIHAAGGKAIVAHPVQLKCANFAQLDTVLNGLLDVGLDGVEVLHSDHRPLDVKFLARFAARRRLIGTAGSDFHGSLKSQVRLGKVRGQPIPAFYFEELWAALGLPNPRPTFEAKANAVSAHTERQTAADQTREANRPTRVAQIFGKRSV